MRMREARNAGVGGKCILWSDGVTRRGIEYEH